MRKSKFKHRKPRGRFIKYILILFCLAAGLALWKAQTFKPEKFVKNSIIQEKTFAQVPKAIQTNGLTAWLLEDHTVPIISVHFLFQNAGYAYDPKGKEGRAVLTAEMLTLGAGTNDRTAFQELLEQNGIGLSFSAEQDDFSGALTTPTANKETAFQLLKDVLTSPKLSNTDIKVVKTQINIARNRQKEHPEGELSLKFLEVLYGNHPYARNPLGKEKDVKNLTQKDLQAFIKDALAQDNLIVGVAGDITAEETAKMLQDVFGVLPNVSKQEPIAAPAISFHLPPAHIERAATQTSVRFAAHGVERTDKDFYPLYIANHIFGGSGLTSRLSLSARENEGLTYGIGTYLSTNKNAPLILGSFSATPENYDKAIKILRSEWKKFAKNGATEQELENACDYLLASYHLRFSSVEGMADMLVVMQKYNLGLDFLQNRNTKIKNVRIEDVNRAAATYFQTLPLEVSIGRTEE